MAYCKKFIILFLILFILLFNFSSCFAVESEEVTYSTVPHLDITYNSNYFTYSNNNNVGYFQLEKGYIYHIYIPSSFTNARYVALSNSIPQENGTYDFLGTVSPGDTFNYLSNSNDYLYFDIGAVYPGVTVTRERVQGQETAINDLVDNVGPNALWGVFGSGIDFVFVIVIVAFGIFIIYKLISGFSKGKSKI